MNTKNCFLIPALALIVCAGAASHAASSLNESQIRTSGEPIRADVTSYVLFQTPVLTLPPPAAVKTLVPVPKPSSTVGKPLVSDNQPAEDKSMAIQALLTAVLVPPAAPVTSPPVPKEADSTAANQQKSPASITVQVRKNPLVSDGYVAILSSANSMDAVAIGAATTKAQSVVGSTVFVVNNIPVKTDDPKPGPITATYTLRFLRGTLPDVTATNDGASDIAGIGTDQAATALAAFLSSVYSGGETTVTAHENRLVLVGPPDHVNALRQMLALSLDVPSPQVKADIYTIQVNTTPQNRDAAQDKIEEIAAGVQIVRDFIHGSQGYLAAYLASDNAGVKVSNDNDPDRTTLFTKMRLAGYDPSPERPLSLMDILILLTVSNRDQLIRELTPCNGPLPSNPKDYTLIDHLEASLKEVRGNLSSGDLPLASAGYNAPDVSVYSRHSAQLVKLIDRIESQIQIARKAANVPVPVFSRLAAAYSTDPEVKKSDIQGMCDFLDAWHDCEGTFEKIKDDKIVPRKPFPLGGTMDPQDYPDRLSRQSAATDLLLKEAMDALTADLQAVYFQPLLDWIRDDVRGGHAGDTGIDLVGTTSITVRDRTLAETKGMAESYFKFTQIPHLTMDSLTGAKNQSPSALATTVFGVLTPLQSLALQAALNEDAVVPSYRKIAPGTSLAIRPFVLPDGGSARVQMSLTSTVATDPPAAGSRDVPFDTITSHTVTTEATINAFDLQTVSSFGVQTTAPGDYAWRIPLLDQIPLLGELFHGPRSAATKRQDSIAIVNLTILPRSLDLVPYYVASP